ncbi:MAG TPA: hypothetical protein VKT25_02650, partial [Ktedonobacteraceae bacterium]|nr:hypothetical protein [Ktedonobacteraceae bacterium]
LVRLAALFKQRNSIDEQIAKLIGRPAQVGHIGEYIASAIFRIKLHPSASQGSSDGIFIDGPLAGRNVDIKFYLKHESILDLNPNNPPDYYLVLVGPKGAAASSRGAVRPLTVESVFLFDGRKIVETLTQNGRKVGIASGVRQEYWNAAEIYPNWNNKILPLTNEQRAQLALFRIGV